jgi:hypothetical protein
MFVLSTLRRIYLPHTWPGVSRSKKKIVTAIAKKEVIGINSEPKLKSEIQLLQQKQQQQQNPYSCLYSLPSRDFIIEVENQREIQKV